MNTAPIITLALMLLLAGHTPAFPQGAHPPKTLTMGIATQGWPPYLILPEDGSEPRGIMIDALKEALRKEAYTIRFVSYPEKRCQMLLREGHIDVYAKACEWMPNSDNYYWTDPVTESSDVLVIRNTSGNISIDELKGLRIGIIHGFSYPKLEARFAEGKIPTSQANTTVQLLRMLKIGRIDAAVTNLYVAKWLTQHHADLRDNDFRYHLPPIEKAPYRFAFTKAHKHLALIDTINTQLAIMKQDGRLGEILKKYQ